MSEVDSLEDTNRADAIHSRERKAEAQKNTMAKKKATKKATKAKKPAAKKKAKKSKR